MQQFESMMKRQTVLEYLKERETLMRERICPYCNAHLDSNEKCDCPESQGLAEYTYRVVKEDVITGERGKRMRMIVRRSPLEIGGLYMHLGNGFQGAYRVLELVKID